MIEILAFIFVLGVLVFFHELGHFVAAKACGIYCDRFSLGMPPRIFGMRIGETDYCVGALPIGGYVKMAGQEDAPMDEEDRQREYGHVPRDRWYNSKPVWQRAIVIAAGPLMNLVLAVLLYALVGAIGAEVPLMRFDNRIGLIEDDSPAARAKMYAVESFDEKVDLHSEPDVIGWQTADRIMSLDGEPIENISDVAIEAILGGGRVMEAHIERPLPDGGSQKFVAMVAPKILDEDESSPRFGVAPFVSPLIKSVREDSPAAQHGLKPGDRVLQVDGKFIDAITFTKTVEKLTGDESLTLEVSRDGEPFTVTLDPGRLGRLKGIDIGAPDGEEFDQYDGPPEIVGVDKEITADIQRRDRIVSFNGQPATPKKLDEFIIDHPGESVQLEIERPRILFGLGQRAELKKIDVEITPVGAVGIRWDIEKIFHKVPINEVAGYSLARCRQALERTVMTVVSLFRGDVSPKELGGPVMIYQVTAQSVALGWTWLLEMMAFISINLCVINLLPLPVLDGGHLLFLGIEGIRRRPLDTRFMERFQQAGLVLIIALMIFVTFNDVKRVIEGLLP